MTNPTAVLTAWHKLEHFTPATIPKGKATMPLNEAIWETDTKPANSKKSNIYTIYLGVFSSQYVQDFVLDYFKVEESDPNFRPNDICYASLKLDDHGHYIENSLGISTLPWALHRLEIGKLKSDKWGKEFHKVEDELRSLCSEFFTRLVTQTDGKVETIKAATLSQLGMLEALVVKALGWTEVPPLSRRIQRTEIFIPKKGLSSMQDADLLNSFFIRDLEKLLECGASKTTNGALHDYLRGVGGYLADKKDVARDTALLQKTFLPLNHPNGCWPAGFEPSLMQHFAVSTLMSRLSYDESGPSVLSVNGPPGTGKTTLLRDVVAAIVVKSASALVTHDQPAGGLIDAGTLEKFGGWQNYIARPPRSSAGGGIVVASSNNGAVENISKELPLASKIDEKLRAEAGYFKRVAQECINEDHFGLVSAVLGNAKNRNELINNLWWKKDALTLRELLQSPHSISFTPWDEARNKFELKQAAVLREKRRLQRCRENYERYVAARHKHHAFIPKLDEASNNQHSATAEADRSIVTYDRAETAKATAQQDVATIRLGKPGFFAYWFSGKKRRAYESALSKGLAKFTAASGELEVATERKRELGKLLASANQTCTRLEMDLKTSEVELDARAKAAKADKSELGVRYGDQKFWSNLDTLETQLHIPWHSEQLQTLQSELFIIALEVRESFILTASLGSKKILTTLDGFFAYLKGDYKSAPSVSVVEAMWEMFFLLFPVVSTTFASVQTMFKDAGPGSIPWLFIDEAGQATPASSAGAIWRAQRVVAVGDPMQIEPVVTIPSAITENIGKHFGVGKESLGIEHSVQTMVDRINPLGTTLSFLDGSERTVGIPLRVHRRCESPMFGISNAIAYGKLMLQATHYPMPPAIQMITQFIDCKGPLDGKHFVPAQAEVIAELLKGEIANLGDLPDLFVITPFSEVAWKLRDCLDAPTYKALSNYKKPQTGEVSRWLKAHVGTVHTFQGKEADGVILCLGLSKTQLGAAGWASSSPNLLNVAITRAKRRFVAVGDAGLWLGQPYFGKLGSLGSAT